MTARRPARPTTTAPAETASARRRSGSLARWAVVAVALSVLPGCLLTSVGRPSGTSGTRRYLDPVFASVSVTKDLTYGRARGAGGLDQDLKLDLYQPSGDQAAKRPAIVWAHGGGFVGGTKGDQADVVRPWVKRGYVVVSIDYRLLAPGGCSGSTLGDTCTTAAAAAIEDGKAAVRWLRAEATTYRIDSTRIAFGGFSAGAVIATGVGVSSDQAGSSGNPGHSSRVGGWISASGGLPGAVGVDGTDSPGYLFSGTADGTVPYQWSRDTARALSDAGVLAVLRTQEGGGHDLPDRTVFAVQTANFLWGVLKLAQL